jgi:hypothetical protein
MTRDVQRAADTADNSPTDSTNTRTANQKALAAAIMLCSRVSSDWLAFMSSCILPALLNILSTPAEEDAGRPRSYMIIWRLTTCFSENIEYAGYHPVYQPVSRVVWGCTRGTATAFGGYRTFQKYRGGRRGVLPR